jgi:hypothetical protein
VSIKLRVALVFTAALAFAFAVGGWLYISQLHAQLLTALDSTVQEQLRAYESARSVSGAGTIAVLIPGWSRSSAHLAGSSGIVRKYQPHLCSAAASSSARCLA